MRVEAPMMVSCAKKWLHILTILAAAMLHGSATPVAAQVQGGGVCETYQGTGCTGDIQCPQSGKIAMLCVDGTCQPSCETGLGVAKRSLCSMGETCVTGTSPEVGTRHYCKPAPFTMDLNLLDMCIYNFVEGIQPDTSTTNACSLSRNLAQMLEQDGTAGFNIYDVDLCVKKFLQDPGCSTVTQTCPNGQVYCANDSVCGEGLFCNLDVHRCERECGMITNRDASSADLLDRRCTGSMEVCDYTRGECHSLLDNADTCLKDAECGQGRTCILGICQPGGLPPELTCSIDQDCPSGASCFMGQCVPRCYRSIDCPDSNWYCGPSNTCLPKPKDPNAAAGFNPKEYSIAFGFSELKLDLINASASLPLVILNATTKKEVFAQPNVVFGYRLELTYARKQEAKCQADLATLSAANKADCVISDDEEFFQIKNPFGTIFGTGDASVGVGLNQGAIAKLTPGYYQATLKAIFNNGTTTSIVLRFQKPSPSGDYVGRMTVMSGSIDAGGRQIPLGTSNVSTKLFVDTAATKVQWDTLLAQNNIASEKEYEDITLGYPITGFIHANDSMLFSQPGAANEQQNEIPVKGIYADQLGRMRLVAVIDIAANDCRSENGPCAAGTTDELQIKNGFGRKIRRVIEFIGPYNAQTHDFNGIYREKISGLAPWQVTVDGGFQLKQTIQEDTAITLGALSGSAAAVGFPTNASLIAKLDVDGNNIDDVAQYCAAPEAAKFASQAAFKAYMATFDSAPLFGTLAKFETLISNALSSLGNSQNNITLADYFKGQLQFCTTTVTTNCVNQNNLRCGLSGFRKAILSGWVDGSNVGQIQSAGGAVTSPTLFCPGVPGSESVCPTKATKAPDLVSLQEHNRFYRELAQTYVYQAGSELSDAFYVLFRAANGQPLEAATAFKHKEINLRSALSAYDSVRREVLAPASTAVMFAWPMDAFKGSGAEWIKELHAVFGDRMDTLTELIDLRRRVLTSSTTRNDFTFLKHVMQQEWLQQVYLAVLEHHWQGAKFDYAGQGVKLLDQGNILLAKASDTRNPLGLHPNRVYFENSNLNVTNWQNFRERVTGRLASLQTQSQAVLNELRGALVNKDALLGKLSLTQQEVDATLAEVCGDATPLPSQCDVTTQAKALQTSCRGASCAFKYECDGDECDKVVQVFRNGAANADLSCRADARIYKVPYNETERLCVRGRMGSLLQETVSLDLARAQTVNKVKALLRQVARQQAYIRETQQANGELIDFMEKQAVKLAAVDLAMNLSETAFQGASTAADALDCLIIAGVAAGTNCAGKFAATALKATALTVKLAESTILQTAKNALQAAKEVQFSQAQQSSEVRAMRLQLDNMVTDVENYVAEYEAVTQQLFNLNVQISDTHFLATEAARRYNQNVSDVVSRLIGRESGSPLLRNSMVQEYNAEYQKLLIDTYKMTQAFIHRYNYAEQAGGITNQVYQLYTLADVSSFVNYLNTQEQNYCGASGIDCDAANNRQVFEFSMRNELFPSLRDIVDPATGNVLTAGQQFHNMITSAAYLRRRSRPVGVRTQIELPFGIWLQNRGTLGAAPQPWMITPNECNHVIAADRGNQGGTLAVNLIGTNLATAQTSAVKYEMWRGDTDYLRSCTEKISLASGERKINPFVVGWAPSNAAGSLSIPPAFEVQSQELTACKNNVFLSDPATRDGQTGCFNYFARDRSLGAPDWKLVIPNVDDSQSWLLGSGVATTLKPVIEDIVLYVRYSARPVTN